MNAVNWAEVVTRVAEHRGLGAATINEDLQARGLPGQLIDIVPVTQSDAVRIAELRPLTRHLGLSLADRACLATAIDLNAPAVTADRAWATLSLGIRITVIR
jgi:PIN domain nuclease of toxin-antitoxin system